MRVQLLFDRQRVKQHRNRAVSDWAKHDALWRFAEDHLWERLEDMRRDFKRVLIIGCADQQLAARLQSRPGTEKVVACDLAEKWQPDVVVDEETLPFSSGQWDLIVSPLQLHWVNDVPGVLKQWRQLLTPNGVVMANLWGAETLNELRQALTHCEVEQCGSAAMRVIPMMDVKSLGNLAQQAGFATPITDNDVVTLHFDHLFALLQELRGLGQSNALCEMHPLSKKVLAPLASYYAAAFPAPDHGVQACFELVTFTAVAT